MNDAFEKFRATANQAYHLTMTDRQLEQFQAYYELLITWNEKMNLTAITELSEVLQKHFLDSLAIASCIDLSSKKQILDVGTGAGFPGIPLKIMFPSCEIVLLDSLQKRLTFLDEVIERLQLNGISTVHGRSEDLSHKIEYREQFDLVVSRAVANLSTLSEFCIPFVKQGGLFVAYKSEKTEEEIMQAKAAIHLLGGKVFRTEEYSIPETELYRTLVMIEKVEHTSKKYPRKAGTPLKNPLS
ncbi:MAG: 16S rRNA (guanine(527)-N(7))-methyltransferase RsmG [Lachnospiraceae bacterium]|nr:16S rRNA (guanine(527)-N(7))-methyltransferase RsmG [Lachnospiraceae bacterium]